MAERVAPLLATKPRLFNLGPSATLHVHLVMSTTDLTGSLGLDEARSHIAQVVFENRLEGPEVGTIGLEPEYLIFQVDAAGHPRARLPLEGQSSVLTALGRLVGEGGPLRLAVPGPAPVYELENGGRITFEPGAQIEHSTTVHPSAAAAMDDVDGVARILSDALARESSTIASAGLDLWTDRALVEQQLRAPRYRAMASYLEGRSEHGQVMMRHTGSFQVNLDLGERDVAAQRWRLSNLLSPISTASFACSPEDGWKSRRARAWQGLDPTRTGYPGCMLGDVTVDAGLCYAELALDADVLLFRTDEGGGAVPGQPGFSFGQWIESGHPQRGHPTLADLDYHLTTLFPEVRLRGWLEIRSSDAIPLRLRAAQVVFWVGLLYDQTARHTALDLLEHELPRLRDQWVIAAREGLADKDLRSSAVEVWGLALEGARRLPRDYFRAQDLAVADSYLGTYVEQGKSPADDLRLLLDRDPHAALQWCSFDD